MIIQTQIQIENQKIYQQYRKEFLKEDFSFEVYVNLILEQIQLNECSVKDVVCYPDKQEILIIFISKN